MTCADDIDSVREYYGDVPHAIEVAEHAYVEEGLVALFRAQMAFSQYDYPICMARFICIANFHFSASGEVIARIYNLALSGDDEPHDITGDLVWHSFYLHALLADHARRRERLHLPHRGTQHDRFSAAIQVRNFAMVGIGQPLWAHACDDCEKIIRSGDGVSGEGSTWSMAFLDIIPSVYAIHNLVTYRATIRLCHGRCQRGPPSMQHSTLHGSSLFSS